MKNYIFSFFFFIFSISSSIYDAVLYAQKIKGSTLSGKVISSVGEGVPYATVAVLNDQRKVISFAGCNTEGKFELQNVPEGKYSLEISCVGYEPGKYDIEIFETKTDIGSFVIKEGMYMKEVIVSAERPVVKTQVDKIIYNVELDPDAAKSSTMQILDKVPFVEVDKISGKIKVMGQESGFTITVNGRKSLLLSESNQYVAKILEAGRLKNIELITSPEGKYANQTAVINLVTKSSLPNGLIAEISASGGTDTHFGSGVDLTSKIGKFIYNLGYNYGYSDLYGSKTSTNLTDYKNSDYEFLDGYSRNSPGASYAHNADISASYNISDLDLLSIDFKSSLSNSRSSITSHSKYMNSGNVMTREFNGESRNKTNQAIYVGGINYQRSFKDNPSRLLTASYGFDTRKNKMKYDQLTEALTGYANNNDRTRNNLNNIENTAAIDFYNTVSDKQSYYLTAKYVHRNYGSNSWKTDLDVAPVSTTQLNALDYTQQIGSLQGNYSIKAKKVMLTAEAAFEYTNDNIDYRLSSTSLKKDDKAMLANVRLTYRPTDKSTFILSMQKSFFRPDITYLNPYEDKSIPGRISKGNPDLDNEKIYSSMLMYRFFVNKKLSLSSLVSMRFSDNAVQQYSYMGNDGVLMTTYGNISKSRKIFFNANVNYNPTSWLELNLSGRIAHYKFEYPDNLNSYWDQFYLCSFTSELWSGGTFKGQIQYADPNWATYTSVQSNKQHMRIGGIFSFAQKIGKNLNLYISASNPWETYTKQTIEELSSDFYNYQEETTLGRTVSFSLVYNFGRFKESVKSIQRAVKNTDRTKED